jgi:hypothetical protein
LPKFQSKSLDTSARLRLGELIAARNEAAAEVTAAQSRLSRLTTLADSAAPIRAKIAELDASEAAIFGEWSKADSGPVPSPDTATRAALLAALADSQAQADAGERAASAVRNEIADANAKLAAADAGLALAAGYVALEELKPIADAARAAMETIADARMKGQALSRIIDATEVSPMAPGFAPFRAAYAAASDALRSAFDLPRVSEAAERAFGGQVHQLLAALRADAGAKLEAA